MHIALVYPSLPPKLDGIGDFTSHLAQALAQRHRVTILAGEGSCDPAPNVTIESIYSTRDVATFERLYEWTKTHQPDLLLLQYNPFGYARRGYNLCFPHVVRRIRKELPGVYIALMAHEAFVTTENVRTALMATYQRYQFRSLVRSAHTVLSSSEPWAKRIRATYQHPNVDVFFAGSNVSHLGIARSTARQSFDLKPDQIVYGFFGTAHTSRPLTWLADTVHETRKSGMDTRLLYVGPHGEALHTAFQQQGVPVDLLLDIGKQPAEAVSRAFSAMDIYLCPFTDGASTRRTTLITGLQHGIATLSTSGHNTSEFLRSQNNKAFILSSATDEPGFIKCALDLCQDSAKRAQLGTQAVELFNHHFDWPIISDNLMKVILDNQLASANRSR